MIVALSAFESGSQPDCSGHVHAIKDLIGTTGLFGRAGFGIERGGSMKPGGDPLPEGGVRLKVAC